MPVILEDFVGVLCQTSFYQVHSTINILNNSSSTIVSTSDSEEVHKNRI